jgi:hypothetical protein
VAGRVGGDREKAILTGYEAWRQLRANDGGQLELDLDHQTMHVSA